ncbi:hypothetical protein INT43_008590 [Umbelopsis isabellina]|uniref:Rho-GAP domain-containing protein n=1 Tax=Mortierella isabellina TaxID=91625 RepID=A0A8H7PVJ0_MORIS|nr:hypothetical protein INT43_008590 [Umbelopsis isabellina]
MSSVLLGTADYKLNPADIIKNVYECEVKQGNNGDGQHHYVCIVQHDSQRTPSDARPSGILLCKVSNSKQVVTIAEIPLCAEVKYDISQTSDFKEGIKTGSLINVSLDDKSMAFVFQDNTNMAKFVEELRNKLKSATQHQLQKDKDFGWLNYTVQKIEQSPTTNNNETFEFKRSKSAIGLETSQLNPLLSSDTLPFTAMLQKSSTMGSVKANGLGDNTKRFQRHLDSYEIKKAWLSARMRDKEDEFVDWEDISVFAGTWNVHGSLPEESLAPWLLGNATDDDKAIEPDIYIVGLQEMDLSTQAYLVYDSTRENAWCDAVLKGLGNRAQKYRKVASQQYVSMMLVVLAKESIEKHISEISITYAGIGLMGVMGNKGCISVRFRLYDSYVCCVTSHLAAFMNNVERRNQDYAEICKRISFPLIADEKTAYATSLWNDGGDEGVSFIENSGVIKDWDRESSIFHSDHLIWVGDLNYRIGLTESEVKSSLRQRNLESLIEYDQLSIERAAGRTFQVFNEGTLDFLPTYKFDVGTNRYDTSEKRRAPAWTDRVLWRKPRANLGPDPKTAHHSDIQLSSYDSCMDMMMSDHKPVNALLRLKARKINVAEQAKCKANIVKSITENPEERGPDARISNSFVEFGDVRFMTAKEVSITLENTGQLVASWRFIPKLNEASICKPWLTISQTSGVLGPGEQVVIDFCILIDTATATLFNNDQDSVADMLILRLENGKDFFVVISGNYIPTCFGMSLEMLARLKGPVHSTEKESSASSSLTNSPEVGQNGTVPKEIWQMLDFMWNEKIFKLEDLFLKGGDVLLAQYILKCLDSGTDFDETVLLGTKPVKGGSADEVVEEGIKDAGNTHLERRKSQEAEALDSLAKSDAPNAIEHQTSTLNATDDNESEELTDEVNPTIGANSVIDVLVAMLTNLPEPVIPSSHYKRIIDGSLNSKISHLKEHMSPVHYNVLIYVTDFLREAVRSSPAGVAEARQQKIVEVFADALLRPPMGYSDRNPKSSRRKRQQIISAFLTQ